MSLRLASLLTAVSGTLLIGILTTTSVSAATPASTWTADPASSTLEFNFVQAGAKTTGRFSKFTANIEFAASATPQGKFDVVIDMSSVDTRDKERDSQLKTADLFDVSKQPQSSYSATSFVASGTGYEGRGKLTLRGVTRDVPIFFTFQAGTDATRPSATLKGTANLKRLQFGVGQGEWKSTEWINDDVQVVFNLHLVPRSSSARH